jgi:hypothetical protein
MCDCTTASLWCESIKRVRRRLVLRPTSSEKAVAGMEAALDPVEAIVHIIHRDDSNMLAHRL